MTPTGTEALRDLVARNLVAARERTELLTGSVDDADLVRQHSPLMSPLVWDLAHVANQEELWLLREVGGRDPMHPEIDPLYDAFEHPRAEGDREEDERDEHAGARPIHGRRARRYAVGTDHSPKRLQAVGGFGDLETSVEYEFLRERR